MTIFCSYGVTASVADEITEATSAIATTRRCDHHKGDSRRSHPPPSGPSGRVPPGPSGAAGAIGGASWSPGAGATRSSANDFMLAVKCS